MIKRQWLSQSVEMTGRSCDMDAKLKEKIKSNNNLMRFVMRPNDIRISSNKKDDSKNKEGKT